VVSQKVRDHIDFFKSGRMCNCGHSIVNHDPDSGRCLCGFIDIFGYGGHEKGTPVRCWCHIGSFKPANSCSKLIHGALFEWPFIIVHDIGQWKRDFGIGNWKPDSKVSPTYIYKLFDENMTLLYVGITSGLASRFSEHKREKPWWPEVMFKQTESFQNRYDALEREKLLIESLTPKYNIVHNYGRGI